MKRAILVVLDSVGVGELQDAKSYGDEGSHTLDHVYKACNGLEIKELEKLGGISAFGGNLEGVSDDSDAAFQFVQSLTVYEDESDNTLVYTKYAKEDGYQIWKNYDAMQK